MDHRDSVSSRYSALEVSAAPAGADKPSDRRQRVLYLIAGLALATGLALIISLAVLDDESSTSHSNDSSSSVDSIEVEALRQRVEAAFPDAQVLLVDEFLDKVTRELDAYAEFDSDNSLATVSMCRDELTYPMLRKVRNMFVARSKRPPFVTGALGGMAFLGAGGMRAAMSHVDSPASFVHLGFSHIGFDQDLEVFGKVWRVGMRKPTATCGAVHGALGKLHDNREGSCDDELVHLVSTMQTRIDEGVATMPETVIELTVELAEAINTQLQRAIFEARPNRDDQHVLYSGVQVHASTGPGEIVDFIALFPNNTFFGTAPDLPHKL